jgi:hypothetical protein
VHSPAPAAERSQLIYLGDIDDRAATNVWLKSRGADVAVYLQGDRRYLLESAGWRVPQKIAFVSLSKDREMAGVAGVVQSAAALGTAAVDLVAAQLQRNEFGRQRYPLKVMLDGDWTPGLSLPWRQVRPTSRSASRPSPKP